MKAKISRGGGFRGVLAYVCDRDKDAENIGGTVAGETMQEQIAEFERTRAIREDIKKPVYHMSLSLPPGEQLDVEKWGEVAEYVMKEMRFDGYQWSAWRHKDRDHDHIHIVACTIPPTGGRVWDDGREVYRAIHATQRAEKVFGLTPTSGLDKKTLGKPSLKRGEAEAAMRDGTTPAKVRVADAIKAALHDHPMIHVFADRLEKQGIRAVPNVAATGAMNGFSFEVNGIAVKGSACGARWKELREAIDYEMERDTEYLRGLRRQAEQRKTIIAGPDAGADGGGRTHPGDDGGDRGGDTGRARGSAGTGKGGEKMGEKTMDNPRLGDGRGGMSGNGRDSFDTPPVPVVQDGDDDAGHPEKPFVKPESTAMRAKREAWRGQARALDAQRYSVIAVPRDPTTGQVDRTKDVYMPGYRGGVEYLLTAEEVEETIPRLVRENIHNRDIYITPIDGRYHYLMLDDITAESITDMKKDGLHPCAVWETSKNNYQAVLKIGKKPPLHIDDTSEKTAVNAVLRTLTEKYHADKAHSSTETPLRMCGFNNKKPGHGNPPVYLREASGAVSTEAAAMVAAARAAVMEELGKPGPTRAGATATGRPDVYTPGQPTASDECRAEYRRVQERWIKIIEERGQQLDWSAIDLQVSSTMIKNGWHPDSVYDCIRRESPNFPRGHTKPTDYLGRTVKKAMKAAESSLKKGMKAALDGLKADLSGVEDDWYDQPNPADERGPQGPSL